MKRNLVPIGDRPLQTMPQQRSGPSRCFGVILLFAAFGLGVNFLFLLRLESKSADFGGLLKPQRKLAVVVPAHDGDLDKALASLALWPTKCSPLTLANVDLVIYYAQLPDDKSDRILPSLAKTGGRCFARTSVVFGNLTEEENVYPKGPSVQFYKLFLDNDVRVHVKRYDAVAILEWDVVVAHDESFEQLYHATFDGVEPFWVKGSTLAGTNFHGTAMVSNMWHVLGHLNGNAIYNNTDPYFVEFVEFTLKRWKYDYSYDVALWATIADFPYSWPLWQRFSKKFVATNLIANVGFFDVDERTVTDAVAGSTLFIHGSLSSGGSSKFLGPSGKKTPTSKSGAESWKTSLHNCKLPCGTPNAELGLVGTSTVCDSTCRAGVNGPRFGGLLCGAENEEKYGAHCRLCYEDVAEARKAEAALRVNSRTMEPNRRSNHAIMCNTMRPPQAAQCSSKCFRKKDTVCDDRCGTGLYGDYNCNWRDRGVTCRYCFDDIHDALAADKAAQKAGGRVIMCSTHEPPMEGDDQDDGVEREANHVEDAEMDDGAALIFGGQEKEERAPPDMRFNDDLVRSNLCAFASAYHVFLSEALVTVKSILHFMPGMRVVLAVHPAEFSVFNRTMGEFPWVVVVNSTAGGHASLLADVHCGNGTKLIFYMNPGDVLYRTITSKDTHGTNGKLLVPYAEPERVDEGNQRRVRATTAVLGFGSPSFSYGTDLLLPAATNSQLRDLLLAGHKPEMTRDDEDDDGSDDGKLATRIIAVFRGVFVPEVLAALAYSRSPDNVWFLNPQQWVTHHMFRDASIWDIPLVKPRFGCGANLALSLQGYDVAKELEKLLVDSPTGGCERGFLDLEPSHLKPKRHVEFGKAAHDNSPPDISSMRVSVMYTATASDAPLFELTFPTVIKNFPGAKEVVIVVSSLSDRKVLLSSVEKFLESTSFPISVVVPFAVPLTDVRILFPLLWAGEYCTGDFVLHLSPNSVILQPVRYENVFHFGKPVLPFTRIVDYGGDAERCWRGVASEAMGTDVIHEFATFDNHVYPMSLYAPLRHFLSDSNGASVKQFMVLGGCDETRASLGGAAMVKRFRRVMEYSLMATFTWFNIRERMHWRALDPLDVQPDEWMVDIGRFGWSCEIQVYPFPDSEDRLAAFKHELESLGSTPECHEFMGRWVTPDISAGEADGWGDVERDSATTRIVERATREKRNQEGKLSSKGYKDEEER